MLYEFKNLNPLGKIEEDCVTRATANALDLDYYFVQKKLKQIGELFECESLCVCCYKFLLDYFFGLKRDENYQGMEIRQFAKMHRKGTYIIRTDGHLTCVRNGVISDTWDCGERLIDIVWRVH